MFELQHNCPDSSARAGVLSTERGDIHTPIFMPVGTQGSVKAIQQRELHNAGAEIILGNTYHLYLRPNMSVMEDMGGLHKFINWDKPILTDSGGFQVFSLKDLRKINEDGVRFASHIDGSRHVFTSESVIDIQRSIGSDIMMIFDECTPYPAEHSYAKESMERSLRWAKRCKVRFDETDPKYGKRQFLFGIGQGSVYKDLRQESMERLVEFDFDGYAIGGLAVGEERDIMNDMVEFTTQHMPKDKARYLMGVGTPRNILESIERGIDMFDCVMPTRNARNGQLFTTEGKVNIRNAKFERDDTPIDAGLDNYASANFSRGYLRHLLRCGEIFGLQLASVHNINFYLWLVKTARQKIIAGEFVSWKNEFLQRTGY